MPWLFASSTNFVFHEEGFQLPAPSQYTHEIRQMTETQIHFHVSLTQWCLKIWIKFKIQDFYYIKIHDFQPNFSDWWLKYQYLLCNYSEINVTGPYWL